jgi:hypothetical protein
MRREMAVGLFANGPTELNLRHVDRGSLILEVFGVATRLTKAPRSINTNNPTTALEYKHLQPIPALSHTSNSPQIILSDPEAGLLAGVLHGCRASSGTSRGIQSMP